MPRGFLSRFGLPVFAAALLAFAVSTVASQPERTPAEPSLPAPSTPFGAAVAGVGVIEPRNEAVAIGTNIAGIVTAVHVKAGDVVEAGAPLFIVDDRAARAELTLAESRVRSAEVMLADARDQSARTQRSYAREVTSDAEATRQRFAVALAAARLDEARAEQGRLATEIDRLTVTAPIAARVWRVNVRLGEFAQTGSLAEPLLILGDPLLQVRVEVDQTDAYRVRADARAVGSLRGDGGKQAPLRFLRFEPLVQPKRVLTGDGTERVDTRVLEVVYALESEVLNAFVGQQMDVFIEAEPTSIDEPGTAGAASGGEARDDSPESSG